MDKEKIARHGMTPEKPRNHGKVWSVKDMMDLTKYWAKPITVRSVAEKVGRSESAVRIRIRIIRIAVALAKDFIKSEADFKRVVNELSNVPGHGVPYDNKKKVVK